MKYLTFLILLLVGACAYLFIYPVAKPGTVVVSQAFMDSLTVVANLPNDTTRDTISYTKYVEVERRVEVPVPIYVSDSLNFYSDTTNTEDIQIVVRDTVKGTIQDRQVTYILKVPRYITTTVKEYVPVPVISQNKDPALMKYVEVGFGYGYSIGGGIEYRRFRFGVEGIQTKNSTALLIKTGIIF
jgi:hypothetical protein